MSLFQTSKTTSSVTSEIVFFSFQELFIQSTITKEQCVNVGLGSNILQYIRLNGCIFCHVQKYIIVIQIIRSDQE